MSGQESSLLEEFMATISVPDDEIDLARAAGGGMGVCEAAHHAVHG